LERFVR